MGKGIEWVLAALNSLRCAHGRLVLVLAVFLTSAGAASIPSLLTGEDASVLVPDQPPRLAEDFELLSRAPLARRLFILLQAEPEAQPGALDQAADALVARLGPPLFKEPGAPVSGPEMLTGILELSPRLLTPEEVKAWADTLTPDEVRRRLQGVRQTLASPQGAALKPVLRLDPLNLRAELLAKLPRLGTGGGGLDTKGRLRPPDGRSLVLTAATDIPFTDAAGSERLLAGFQEILRDSLPAGVSGYLVSGHRHSLANAVAVKADLLRVIPLSASGLALVILIFLRRRESLWVLLVPPGVLCLAGAATGALLGGLHSIVFGFGGVLMGLAVDYPLHVQHALNQSRDPSSGLEKVSQPLVFGALTTLAAFSPLLLSQVPAIRQMALFSMLGIVAAVLISFLVLPQLLPCRTGRGTPAEPCPMPRPQRAKGLVLAFWAIALCVLTWMSLGLRLNTDFAALGIADPQVRADEDRLRSALGGFRDHAMVFASGSDLAQASERNARVLTILRASPEGEEVLTLAPLLPPPKDQERNSRAWNAQWSCARGLALAREVLAAGKELGFTDQAFAPFVHLLADWSDGHSNPLIDTAALGRIGLGDALGLLVQERDGECTLLTLLPDSLLLSGSLGSRLEAVDGVHVLSGTGFARDLGAALRRDALVFTTLSLALVCGFLLVLFRQPKTAAAALAPVFTGLAAVTAGTRLAHGGVDLFSIMALPLIVGLAADYGIFMVHHTLNRCVSSGRSVLVCGLTTIVGFGTLAVAQHPALRSLGLSILLGIGAALPTALLVTPRLLGDSLGTVNRPAVPEQVRHA